MGLNKQGIVFSLLAIGFSGLFILLFSSNLQQPVDSNIEVTNIRVLDLDRSIEDFYAYAKTSLDTAGLEALQALYEDMKASGTHLAADTFEQRLLQCLNDSTGCNNDVDLITLLEEYENLLQNTTRTDMDFTINSMAINDEKHWQIEVEANITVNLTDEYASWTLHRNLTNTISTIGARDPTYLSINDQFGGTTEKYINPNQRQDFVEWNLPAFADYFTAGEYHASPAGPCLSSRFEGQYDEHDETCGLESVVDPQAHPTLLDATYDDLVHMDYQVLTDQRYPCNELSGGMPRVSIKAIDPALTLTRQDATRYGLNNNETWYFSTAIDTTTARGCEGFI